MTRNLSLFDGNRGNQRFSNTLKKHFPGEPCTEKWQGIKVQASRKVGKQKNPYHHHTPIWMGGAMEDYRVLQRNSKGPITKNDAKKMENHPKS